MHLDQLQSQQRTWQKPRLRENNPAETAGSKTTGRERVPEGKEGRTGQ